MLGERLTELRTTLAKESLLPAYYTRASVAHAAGVSADALARLEKEGTGTATSLATVLKHYQNLGINLAWVLEPDNVDIPFYGFRDIVQDEKLPLARKPLAALHRLLLPVMAELDAGQQLTPHAVHTLLTQVRQGIRQALTHLLPRRGLVQTEADWRTYQRLLPPVPAQSAGWRPASLFAMPAHYYDAGESLPRCGDVASYLAHDPGRKKVADLDKCRACRHRMSKAFSPAVPLDTPATPSR
jgi:transcriptional regulator with XRE-family HTH domain